MASYFRITAYHPETDISVVLDSNGKFEKLWEFSSYLVQKGFKILEVGKDDYIIDAGFERVDKPTNKIYLRGYMRGKPEIDEMTFEDRPCKSISVHNMAYGLFLA